MAQMMAGWICWGSLNRLASSRVVRAPGDAGGAEFGKGNNVGIFLRDRMVVDCSLVSVTSFSGFQLVVRVPALICCSKNTYVRP